jgi:hypothetical protein
MKKRLLILGLLTLSLSAQAQAEYQAPNTGFGNSSSDWLNGLPSFAPMPTKPTASLKSCGWLASTLGQCSAEEIADQAVRDRRAAADEAHARATRIMLECMQSTANDNAAGACFLLHNR